MKREIITKRKGGQGFEPPEDTFFANRPLLAEACCDPVYDDGSPREVWSISLNWCGSMLTASLNDKDQGRSLNTTSQTLDQAADALEALLGAPVRPWRYWGKKKRP